MKRIDTRIVVGCYVRFYKLVHLFVRNHETTRKYEQSFPMVKTTQRLRLVGTVESIDTKAETVIIRNNDSLYNRKLRDIKYYKSKKALLTKLSL